MIMAEYKIGSATVRIHGTANTETVKAATIQFLKRAEKQRRSKRNERKDG
jgi:hypothetical protein